MEVLPMYPTVSLHIAGSWREASKGETIPVLNPATGEPIGTVPVATREDLDEALEAAQRGFKAWKAVSAYERAKIMRKAADRLRERADEVARIMTLEQGKPLAEAKLEIMNGADTIDWFAEEGRRAYGRVVPGRAEGVLQIVTKEPVGPVAAFTPWNFPINQAVRKVSAALCTGCSVILKGPEDTPASCAELVKVFLDAGVPGDVVSLVFGRPAEISEYLIPHPVIRKISFTGSTAVGKQLAALAGHHMKRVTMELGGHAPAIVFKDADVAKATKLLGAAKYRNAGQVCISPTRFLVHETIYDEFVDGFVAYSRNLKVGEGLDPQTKMGPLAHARRIEAMESFVNDAQSSGATMRTGGKRIGNQGFFFEPTVFTEVPTSARIMNEEPFGPVAAIVPFKEDEEAFEEANRLPYGLSAYAYTRSAATAAKAASVIESGMVSINHHGLGIPEVPFGGVKDSGYGSEGGLEAIEAYLNTKFVSQVGL
jgi:succinate-semialdehyde dehydrogenase / glutarate-semialdehyde dehydrogenase